MRKIIVDNYNKFKGKLQVRLKLPENVPEKYIQLTLDSKCGSKEKGANHEITCQVTVQSWERFSLNITLDRKVCDLGLPNFKIEVSVFGQTDSNLTITVGEIFTVR